VINRILASRTSESGRFLDLRSIWSSTEWCRKGSRSFASFTPLGTSLGWSESGEP